MRRISEPKRAAPDRKVVAWYAPESVEDALVYGRLIAAARRGGRPARVGAAEIAAVAIRHGFAIAMRNTGDFAACGVPLLNPWRDPL